MVARIAEVMTWLDAHAPFRYAANWDNCGLLVGDPQAEVARILVALDVTPAVLAEAEAARCECLVTHHPLLFQPLKSLRFDQAPADAQMPHLEYIDLDYADKIIVKKA